jgi:pilus assembly protein Flp/PilA
MKGFYWKRIEKRVRSAHRRRGKRQHREALMTQLLALLARRDDEGQGLAEYALILALIAIVAIIALIFLGGQVSQILSNVGNSV